MSAGTAPNAPSLVHGLREHGWIDAFRALHGYAEREASWTFHGDRGGWRLDHVLVLGLRPVACAYAHDWRRAGLSDHSALVADLVAAASGPEAGNHVLMRAVTRARRPSRRPLAYEGRDFPARRGRTD